MRHLSYFLSFCLFYFLVIPHGKSSSISAVCVDIINQTCKTCADESASFNYNFCLTSLQTVPVSHAANLQGLALVAMELALQNASNTVSSIKELLTNTTSFDSFAFACLEDCMELYLGAVLTIVDSVGAFLSEHYINAKLWLSLVMEAVTTCEEGFAEKEGEVSPLTKKNQDLIQLCNTALCIINLLTHAIPS